MYDIQVIQVCSPNSINFTCLSCMFRLYLVYQSVDSALQMRAGSLSGVQGPVPWNLAWRFGWKTRAMSVYDHLVQRIETSLSLASSKWLSINLKFVCGGNQWGQFQKNDLQRYYRCFHMYFEDLNQTGLIVLIWYMYLFQTTITE